MPTDADVDRRTEPTRLVPPRSRVRREAGHFLGSEDVINKGDHIGAKSQIWEVNSVINYNLRVI